MPGLMKDAIPWVAPVHQLFVGANYMQFIYNIGATVKVSRKRRHCLQSDGYFSWVTMDMFRMMEVSRGKAISL